MRRSVEFSYEDIVKRNERRGFTSMVKPVGSLCNMRCKYCYYLDKAALYNNHQPQMDDALLENYIRANIEGNNSPVIAFAWHGGEPLLAGKDFFRKAVALQQRYAGGKSVENSIQTNGLLIDDEWCQIFRDNNFLVGVSIDGPESIHDAHRVDAGGNPTFARVMKGIERLYRNRVEYNTLSTVNVHSEGQGREVYRFLRGISMFMQFLPVAELLQDGVIKSPDTATAEIAPWSISSRGFGEFMCDVFDEWVAQDVGKRYVQLFDATLALEVGVMPSICSLCETCGSGLTVEHNGDVYSCDHFVYPRFKLGNLLGYAFVGGVLQAGVEESGFLQVEQACHLVACLVLEGGRLVDRQHAGFALLRLPSALYANGVSVHNARKVSTNALALQDYTLAVGIIFVSFYFVPCTSYLIISA